MSDPLAEAPRSAALRLPPELEAFFARTEPSGSASSRERHTWTRREVAVARTLPEFPPVRTVAELFTTSTLALLWELGCTDRLRSRTARRSRREGPQSVNTRLARWSSLNRLLEASGCAAELPPRPQPAPRVVPIDPDEGVRVADEIEPRRQRRFGERDLKMVRLLAVVGLILDTGARTAELHALRWDDFGPELSTVTLVRYGPGANVEVPPLREVYALSRRTREALEDWRTERDALAAGIQGADEGKVWVTLSASRSGPPGRSLALGGLARTYNTVIDLLEAWTGTSLPPHLKDLSLARAECVTPLSSQPLS
ncbi:site-specific integrase [Streptacidiphilus rugosus]|uniref:site-specific integrase n=1 Tax=Streptacidiphilus rugosus TaxID=405783 RepID=UPI000568CB19|nr:site-specific integrase [Streptacidiphilus rugosus]